MSLWRDRKRGRQRATEGRLTSSSASIHQHPSRHINGFWVASASALFSSWCSVKGRGAERMYRCVCTVRVLDARKSPGTDKSRSENEAVDLTHSLTHSFPFGPRGSFLRVRHNRIGFRSWTHGPFTFFWTCKNKRTAAETFPICFLRSWQRVKPNTKQRGSWLDWRIGVGVVSQDRRCQCFVSLDPCKHVNNNNIETARRAKTHSIATGHVARACISQCWHPG